MNMNPSVIWTDIRTFFPMVWAILRGRYKMPWGTFFWALLCLAYVISPVDVLPDILPILGITDDGAFIILVLTLVHKDLVSFRQTRRDKATILEAEIISPQQQGENHDKKSN